MAFQYSPWVDINGEDPEHDGRSKRRCTGLGNASEPRSMVQTQWDGSLPEQSPYDRSRYNSNTFDVQGRSASAVDFDDVSWQHVGSVQGQTYFQSHQNLPWPSSDYNPQPSWLEVVDTAPSSYHRVPDAQAPLHPASNAFESWNPPSSVTTFQPTPTSDISLRGESHDVGAIPKHGCQDSSCDSTSELKKGGDTVHEDTSYELCLGLVGQVCFWDEALGL